MDSLGEGTFQRSQPKLTALCETLMSLGANRLLQATDSPETNN
jgi:hypothetical protein